MYLLSPQTRRWFTSGIAAIAGVGLMLAPPVRAADAPRDVNITDHIEDELIFDQAVTSQGIDVQTINGIVTLEGRADDILERKRAARIARSVRGVRSVVNELDVEPLTVRTDAEIKTDIRQALVLDPATQAYDVTCTVNNGQVTLTGTVQSGAERMLTEKVASSVRGVRGVTNNIVVNFDETLSDSQFQNEIEQLLKWRPLIDHTSIDVSVKDGHATLRGTVGSAAERHMAINAVWMAGIIDVNAEDLEVDADSRSSYLRDHAPYVDISDGQIADALNDALMYDPRVFSFNVKPEVRYGHVTLRGEVDNLKARRAADQVARDTLGVLSVTNRIRVKPSEDYDDATLNNHLRDALLRDATLDLLEIDSSVSNGVAYLSGTVDTYFEKAQADDVASRVAGIVAVVNNIDVDNTYNPMADAPYIDDGWSIHDYPWYDYQPGRTFKTDIDIRRDIRSELTWSPFVDADQVNVTVIEGIATLTGEVDSWSEYRAAAENAIEGGAVWVNNELTIK